MITIESADNGWILRDDTEDESRRVVAECDHDALSNARAVQRLLYAILDLLGETGSKHDPARVRVIVTGPDGREIEGG